MFLNGFVAWIHKVTEERLALRRFTRHTDQEEIE